MTVNPNTPFPLFVRTVTNSYQTLSRNTRETRKNLEKIEIRLKPNTFGQSPKDAAKRMSSNAPRRLVQIVQERSQRKYGHTHLKSILLFQAWKKFLREKRSMWRRWQFCSGEPLSLTLLNWYCPKCYTGSTSKFRRIYWYGQPTQMMPKCCWTFLYQQIM